VFVDTLSVNAHTVALDFLWAGVPVISAAGDAWSSRVAASALLAHGWAFGLGRDVPEYFAVARALARRAAAVAPGIADWGALRSRTPSSLFATSAKVRELVRAYALMVELHALRIRPMHICMAGGVVTPAAAHGPPRE
jgi:predicted O-linked N-acetylglucosamine transferase (SPINDLY family)